MTKYSLRARMMILILAPTLMIGLLLSTFFVVHRYNELQHQVHDAGANIIEPLAVSSEYGMTWHNRDAIRELVSLLHRRHSDIVRAITIFDNNNHVYVTSNNNQNLALLQKEDISTLEDGVSVERQGTIMILRTPIISERYSVDELPGEDAKPAGNPLGYVAIELDLQSVRLEQYKEVFVATLLLLFCLCIAQHVAIDAAVQLATTNAVHGGNHIANWAGDVAHQAIGKQHGDAQAEQQQQRGNKHLFVLLEPHRLQIQLDCHITQRIPGGFGILARQLIHRIAFGDDWRAQNHHIALPFHRDAIFQR